jgi:endonuclease/exonuclease/phosphatase family metal-dependent hydrolase
VQTALAAFVVSAAVTATAEEARASCRGAASGTLEAPVHWVAVEDPEEAASLALWCVAVGPPVGTAPAASAAYPGVVDGLAVVVWNVKAGAGEVERLVAQLRAGELTGGNPVGHFVLLLQEALRVGSPVPREIPPGGVSARAVGEPAEPTRSIEAVAARAGLFGFYAPSMRNGAEQQEDRGNAILSTLPLASPVAIELPYERQRRIVVSALIEIPTRDGRLFPLRVVSAHLDNSSRAARFWRSFGSGRERQARALREALRDERAVVLGGDFNTWFGGSEEAAVELLRDAFPLPGQLPAAVTYAPPFGLPERQVDYLMLRLPAGWNARYQVARDWRGSDHAALIGWVEQEVGIR